MYDIVNFCLIMVFLAISNENYSKRQNISESPNVAHFEVQKCFLLDMPRLTLVCEEMPYPGNSELHSEIVSFWNETKKLVNFRKNTSKHLKVIELLSVVYFEAQNSFQTCLSIFTCLTKKVVTVNSELIWEIATLCPMGLKWQSHKQDQN